MTISLSAVAVESRSRVSRLTFVVAVDKDQNFATLEVLGKTDQGDLIYCGTNFSTFTNSPDLVSTLTYDVIKRKGVRGGKRFVRCLR